MTPPFPAGRVTVVGSLNVDTVWQVPVLPRPGQTVRASATERQFGGKGANQAVAAARQGARVALVGAVGDDADGRAYREHLAREGIDTGRVTAVPGVATGAAHVYVDPRGENLIVVDVGANVRIEIGAVAAALARTDVLVVQLETSLAVAGKALALAATAGVRAVFNPSPTQPEFPWGAFAIDTVVVNEHECAECFRRTPEELLRMSELERLRVLAEFRVQHLVVTQGAEPTLYFSGATLQRVPTYPVTPRDTVGAGDTFTGALAAQLAAGRTWEPALRYANVAAALSTLALGAQAAMPRAAEVEAAIAASGNLLREGS